MARTSHREIKKAVSERIRRISDKDFFRSAAFCGYLTDIAEAMSKRYEAKEKLRVSVVYDMSEGAFIARTDNSKIELNCGCDYCNSFKSRESKYNILMGLMMHEIGHVLYTNFRQTEVSAKTLQYANITPIIPEAEEQADAFDKYLSSIHNRQIKGFITRLWRTLLNILEDAHVNRRIVKRFPGYGVHLNFVLDIMYQEKQENEPFYELVKKEKDGGKIFTLFSLIHFYALYSEVNCRVYEEKNERILMLNEVMDFIDESVFTNSSSERMALQNTVFIYLLPYLKEFIDPLLEEYGNDEFSMEDMTLEDMFSEIEDGLDGTEIAERLSVPTAEAETETEGSSEKMKLKEKREKKSAIEAEPLESSKEDMTIDSEESKKEVTEEADKRSIEDIKKIDDEKASEGDSDEVKDEDGKESSRETKEKLYENSAKDIQRILDKMEKESLYQAENEILESELNEYAASVKHSSIHHGVRCEVQRISEIEDSLILQYESIAPPLVRISRMMGKRYQKLFAKKRKGSKMDGLYSGRHFEARSVVHQDGKYFSRKIAPNNHPTLSVALLVDESGSTCVSDRSTYERAAAIILYDFCTSLGIPISIYGHYEKFSGDRSVVMKAYAEFDKVDLKDRFRLMDIQPHENNRDGYAIRYMAEKLLHQNSDFSLLIIASDGQPAACNYNGMAACEDIASIVREYKRKGITTIAAAIGDDKEAIEYIYKENYLDIKNLEELPTKLISIVKKYIK